MTFARKITVILVSEHGGDALRNTIAVLLSGLGTFFITGRIEYAIIVGTGTLLSCLTDMPGNKADKWRSLQWCIPLFLICSFITAFVLSYSIFIIVWLVTSSFGLMMLSVYGPRVNSTALMTIILITFTIGIWPPAPLTYSICITIGVAIYYAISLLQIYVQPHRSLRYAMVDSFHSMSVLLKAKVKCYDESIALEAVYKELGGLHIKVSEQHEMVRSLLFGDKRLLASSKTEKFWLQQILGLTDLYELLTALDHDYEAIRKVLQPLGVLTVIRKIITLLGQELEVLSINYLHASKEDDTISMEIHQLLHELQLAKQVSSGETVKILDATIKNIGYIMDGIQHIKHPDHTSNDLAERYHYQSFLTLPGKGWGAVKSQLKNRGPVFYFSLRLALLFGIGGLFGFFLPEYRYSYWILLTLVIVARPSFAITQRRNTQRISGTMLGLAIGLVLIYCIPSSQILLLIAVLGLFGFFLFNRINYMFSVVSLTPAVLIALHVYEGNIIDILGSRVAFTLFGSVLAILGWFFIPIRQSRDILSLANSVVNKNVEYLDTVKRKLYDHDMSSNTLRLVRKQTHTLLASFSDVIIQLQKEPGKHNWNWEHIHQFHALAYRINSLTIGVSLTIIKNDRELDMHRINDLERLLNQLISLSEGLKTGSKLSS